MSECKSAAEVRERRCSRDRADRGEIGGIVIYAGGRPAYYVLRDEWFEALPEPRPAVRVVAAGEGTAAADVDPAAVLRVS